MNIWQKAFVILQSYWFFSLQRLGCANFFVNKIVERVDPESIMWGDSVYITTDEYFKFAKNANLSRWIDQDFFPHTKVLEYMTSWKLLQDMNVKTLLDAAGGYEAEFANSYNANVERQASIVCQDANPPKLLVDAGVGSDIKYITGSISSIPLRSGTIDAITCHHSFEHFEGNVDVEFILEALRLLAVGGKIIICPIFITNGYFEITTSPFRRKSDSLSCKVFDPTASFAGWGSFQGFARTYSEDSLNHRIISRIPENFSVSVHSVYFDNSKAPRFDYAFYQPKLNMGMMALVITREH